jgi:metalloprotein, YbeY/UPF0054 family
MSLIFENNGNVNFEFDCQKVISDVVNASLDYVHCPYEATVEVTLVDNEKIHSMNREFRQIDKPTDVLSFPMLEYETPGEFSFLELEENIGWFYCDTGELMLGDILISAEQVRIQAEEYGHSEKRELAFLTAHSMLHLFGYDHMEEKERFHMEKMQDEILNGLKIYR